jgi:ankyrin repeat protein
MSDINSPFWYSDIFIDAASHGDFIKVKKLIDLGAPVDRPDYHFHRSPIHFAALAGSIEVVDLLLKSKANPNFFDKEGETALHDAVRMNNFEMVKLLVRGKANLESLNFDGLTPYQVAVEQGLTQISSFLRKKVFMLLVH